MGKTLLSSPNQKMSPFLPLLKHISVQPLSDSHWHCTNCRAISAAGTQQGSPPGTTGLFSAVLVTMASGQHEINTQCRERKCFYFPSLPWNKRVSFFFTGILYLLFLFLTNVSIKKLSLKCLTYLGAGFQNHQNLKCLETRLRLAQFLSVTSIPALLPFWHLVI